MQKYVGWIFFGNKTGCTNCHNDFNFTNYTFENNGLNENYSDLGRFRLTGDENDRAKFKVPTLRNIAVTPPFMHDGRFNTLEEVVNHYNEGIKESTTADQTVLNTKNTGLLLTEQDKQDLVNFLHTLTDETFLNNEEYKTPF